MDKYRMEINFILLRQQRDEKLKETDKYMLPDYPITPEDLEKMKIYRQELRSYMNNLDINNPISEFPLFPF